MKYLWVGKHQNKTECGGHEHQNKTEEEQKLTPRMDWK